MRFKGAIAFANVNDPTRATIFDANVGGQNCTKVLVKDMGIIRSENCCYMRLLPVLDHD